MHSVRNHHLLLGLASMIIGMFVVGAAVFASANVSLSFSSAISIPPDSLVSTVDGSPNYVELANLDNAQRLVGVAVSNNQSTLVINSTNNAQVAVSGVVEASVSTINGDINVGDQVSVSSIDGVGMKAGKGSKAIGIAESALTSKTSETAALDTKDKAGNDVRIYIGHVTVNLASSNFSQTQTKTGLLSVAQNVASSVSGHQVTELQTILSFVVAILAIIATSTLVYATARGGIISLGRNPLARLLIVHSIEEMMAMIPAIVIISVVIIYFILR